jgi:hypothetical protein
MKNLGVEFYACHHCCGKKYKIGGEWSRTAWTKSETLSSKYPEQKGLEV